MNQPYARVNQPYATLTLASALREMFGVQLYKNNARAILSRILSILNLDWLQHARSVRGVYESCLKWWKNAKFRFRNSSWVNSSLKAQHLNFLFSPVCLFHRISFPNRGVFIAFKKLNRSLEDQSHLKHAVIFDFFFRFHVLRIPAYLRIYNTDHCRKIHAL